MSPELLNSKIFGLNLIRKTKSSDSYALGMVIYEVLSGQVPFFQHHGYIAVRKVLDGERPERPQGARRGWFTDDVWRILEHCWQPKPTDRPSVKVVLFRWECLEEVSGSWTPPSPLMVEDSQSADSSTWSSPVLTTEESMGSEVVPPN